jgi:hydrogenase nickel incorporation protein HypB
MVVGQDNGRGNGSRGMKEIRLIEVKEGIFSENDRVAGELKRKLTRRKIFLMNLMASPGAGKTSLIIRTLEALKDTYSTGVIEADIDSMVDAQKVATLGVKTVQLKTRGLCHLDATMVTEGLEAIGMDGLDLIIIENVGNLVCPAEFDTGAALNAMILSVPEGDDKPLKYPLMFEKCDLLLINKVDLLPYTDFDIERFRQRVLDINPHITMFEVSGKTGQGIEDWIGWLKNRVESMAREI